MPDPTPANPPGEKSAVLLVDDERQLIELIAEILSQQFEVDLATSTDEAGRLIRQKQYKVIVCDYNMPGDNGLKFLTKLCKEFPKTRRILITGYMQPELVNGLNAADLFRYLLKPISMPALVKVVQDAAKDYDQYQSVT